jgi:hypothetical protein
VDLLLFGNLPTSPTRRSNTFLFPGRVPFAIHKDTHEGKHMAAIDPNVIGQLNNYAMSVVDGIFREAEQKMVKPLDSTFGEWVKTNFKADIKDLQGFKAVATWFIPKLQDGLESPCRAIHVPLERR